MAYSSEELLALLDKRSQGTISNLLDIKFVRAEKEHVEATMPVTSLHHQPFGYLHGGVSVVLAETLASIGSLLNIDATRQQVFGLEINANHLRPKQEGVLTGIATPIQRGRTTHVWDIRISDENGKPVCISRCTIAVVALDASQNKP